RRAARVAPRPSRTEEAIPAPPRRAAARPGAERDRRPVAAGDEREGGHPRRGLRRRPARARGAHPVRGGAVPHARRGPHAPAAEEGRRREEVCAMKRCLCILLAGLPAGAWETDSTHLGLTEQAAVASGVHRRLQAALGRSLGWLEPLKVAPAGFVE